MRFKIKETSKQKCVRGKEGNEKTMVEGEKINDAQTFFFLKPEFDYRI
jgi:hypothetical protein